MVDSSLGNSFDNKQVSEIPLEGRNVPDLLSLQAWVTYTGNRIGDRDQDTRNGSVNAGSASSAASSSRLGHFNYLRTVLPQQTQSLPTRLPSVRRPQVGAWGYWVAHVPAHVSFLAGCGGNPYRRATKTHAARAGCNHHERLRECADGIQTRSQHENRSSGAPSDARQKTKKAASAALRYGPTVKVDIFAHFFGSYVARNSMQRLVPGLQPSELFQSCPSGSN